MKHVVWYGAVEVILLGPILEEMFYRGILYSAMRVKWNWQVAVPLNAALFAAAHLSWYGFLFYFFSGIILCWSFERTRALGVPIVAHILSNVPSFIALVR